MFARGIDIREEKKNLREKYSKIRRSFSDEKLEADSKAICDLFLSSKTYASAETVLLYMSINSEVRTRDLIYRILSEGKKVALPVCHEKGRMEFRYINGTDDLIKGKFSAPEPDSRCEAYCNQPKSIIVIPAIVFDKEGYRIGYGKGYYDRFISTCDALRVGFSFEELVIDRVPHGRFDKKTDLIITPRGVISTIEK